MAKRKPKKAGKKKSQAKPSPQQLKAIERLSAKGNIPAAIFRLEALIKQYPKFSPLYLQGLDLYNDEGESAKMAWCALRWTQSTPNSLKAWGTLLDTALQQGYLALVIEATKHYNRLAELHNEVPFGDLPIEEMTEELLAINPDHTQFRSMEDALICDIGKLLIDASQWEDSLPYLADINYYPPSANNHALSLFQLGRIEEALESYRTAFTLEPDNLFAMAAYIRLQIWNGDKDGALRTAEQLMNIRPKRPLYAEAQLAALAFLEMFDEAFTCFQKISDEEIDSMEDGFFHVVAVVAFRLGKKELAQTYWDKAPTDLYRGAETNPALLLNTSTEKNRNPGLFTNSEILPMEWGERVHTLSIRSKTDAEMFAQVKQKLTPCPSLEYIQLAYESCDDYTLFILEFLLISRAVDDSQDEKQLLLDLLKSHRTDMNYKLKLLERIQKLGVLGTGDKVSYWTGESISELKSQGFAITREPVNGPLSDIDQDYYDDAIAWMKDGKLAKARKMLEELSEKYPTDLTLKGNIASSWLNEDREKGVAKFESLFQEFPDYIFARCMLAENLIEEDQLDAAEQLMRDALEGVDEVHAHEVILVYGVSALLRAAEGNQEGAESYLNAARSMAEYPDEKQKLKIWEDKVEWLFNPDYKNVDIKALQQAFEDLVKSENE